MGSRGIALGAAVAALLVPSGATAKEEFGGLRFCGAVACRDVTDRGAVEVLLRAIRGPTPRGRAAAPAPFYTLRHLDREGEPLFGWPASYYVPRADVVRTVSDGIAGWTRLGTDVRAFRRAARGLAPISVSRLVRVEVDARPTRDPTSYLRLYRLRARGSAPADPAGVEPAPVPRERLWAYYERVRQHWLPLNLWSARPTPWGDGANFIWVSRRGALLKRDGELLRIDLALAERIRGGRSLRG